MTNNKNDVTSLDTDARLRPCKDTGDVNVAEGSVISANTESTISPMASTESLRMACESLEPNLGVIGTPTNTISPEIKHEHNNNVIHTSKGLGNHSETKQFMNDSESMNANVTVTSQLETTNPNNSLQHEVTVGACVTSDSSPMMTSPPKLSESSFPSFVEDGKELSEDLDGDTPKRREPGTGPRKRKRRGSAWSDEQTEFLMEVWARHTEHNKEGEDFNHNAPVYRIIARSMEETGNPKTWEQCKTRIHTLKRAYKLTKDEITEGATNITYCRHFDTLGIIMGDNETTTPQMLADLLEARRTKKQEQAAAEPTPQKRKPAPLRPSKRPNTQNSKASTFQQPQHVPSAPQVPDSTVATTPNSYWFTPTQPQYEQGQAMQQPPQQADTQGSSSYQNNVGETSGSMPPPPPYPVLNTSTIDRHHVHTTTEINNNDVVIKREKQEDTAAQEHSISTMTSHTWPVPQPPQKEELEKMRLNLELRKIEMERNRLEMEDRQRREERDHQYRMLQLLMFGLGQPSSAQCLSGQGAEQVVAHAQNSTNLSRALENGLVPGGPHSANEKGLSFSEI